MKDVFVTREESGAIINLARFETVVEAEEYIAKRESVDPDGVAAGDYGIDAPEEKMT